ncbi:CoA pyrophosphatase [Cellulosimicrobium cellulans]|uniref:NUDIX hydrolase n=1 Tax=Cellulosimicrobium cellulans TaxID=1710 RepID=UPI001EDC279C|nr:CoA pyrophosphatase [Cellulosimicrobium cellulans]UKJ64635.1 CoA pyrophosphatase [Cellulosimicrobium cellulans]
MAPPGPRASARSDVPARDQLAALAADGGGWPSPWRLAIGRLDERARPAAVLLLFGALDAVPSEHRARAVPRDLDVLLLARAATLGHHPGQVAFPGGRIDPGDEGPVDAALREAMEETGLDRSGVDVLGPLGELPLPVSNHVVTPVLGWWPRPTPVRVVDVAESAHVFRVPVADLLDPERRRTVTVRHDRRVHKSPGFLVEADGREHLVWGFTGGILDALFDRLGWTEPWDRTRTLDAPL